MVTSFDDLFTEILLELATLSKQMAISKPQIQRFKALLMEMRAALLTANETGDEAEQVVELDQTRVGRLSRMDAMQAQAMSLETGRRRQQTLKDITAALTRIDDDEFGECFECAEFINPLRLEANPTAVLCITCAQALE